MSTTPAASEQTERTHRHWSKVVSAAYLRMIGHTQAEAAKAVGRNPRTIREWEADAELWAAAQRQAGDQWLEGLTAAARSAVLRTVKAGNPKFAFKILERVVPELAPPRVRASVINWNPDDFSVEGLRRIEQGEDPAHVLSSGGRRT